jgi:hypothetical protein
MRSLKPSLFAILTALSLLPTTAFAADKEKKPALEGVYHCSGDNGDGTKYKGTVGITESGDTYAVEWVINESAFVGVGIWENERLSVSWATVVNGKVRMGVVVYKREKDGSLSGRWAQYPGGGKVLEETLTPGKK